MLRPCKFRFGGPLYWRFGKKLYDIWRGPVECDIIVVTEPRNGQKFGPLNPYQDPKFDGPNPKGVVRNIISACVEVRSRSIGVRLKIKK